MIADAASSLKWFEWLGCGSSRTLLYVFFKSFDSRTDVKSAKFFTVCDFVSKGLVNLLTTEKKLFLLLVDFAVTE